MMDGTTRDQVPAGAPRHPGEGEQQSLEALAGGVGERLAGVRALISDAGGDPEKLRIVAVTKGRSSLAAHAAVRAGLSTLGENYAQELANKAAAVPGAHWHFIGNLQANKVRRLAGLVALWQSIDRRRLLTEIARHSPDTPVLIQVTQHPTPGRGGCEPDEARRLVGEATALGVPVAGLMTMALPGTPAEVRAQFRAVRQLADELGLAERSMGTSSDFLPAVQEGATLLRLGHVLFAEPRETPA